MPGSIALPDAAAHAQAGEHGQSGGESGAAGFESHGLDDRWVRLVGILGFGAVIPRVTPLLVDLEPHQPGYWLGSGAFVALAAMIWHGNRWLLFEQRRHYGWFDHPLRKLSMLLAAVVLYTTPLTIVSLLAWYGWLQVRPDWGAIRTVTLINVICVVFVTHAYETVFLIKERESDLLRVARTDRARVQAELAAFLAQVDPHFMFNALNTLGHLIETDAARAVDFTQYLAELYRYLLRQRGRALVPLGEELEFSRAYVALMAIRYGDALRCAIPPQGPELERAWVPPTALQLLIENAIKHNEVGPTSVLTIEVALAPDALVARNVRRPRRSVAEWSGRPSPGLGLRNLDERCLHATGQPLSIVDDGAQFVVRVPLAFDATQGNLA